MLGDVCSSLMRRSCNEQLSTLHRYSRMVSSRNQH
jgi:hypothetical protein